MTTATLQTPLEVILFFNSLTTHGVKQQSFQTISETLKADRDVRESDGFDEARLSPESLQQLYLALLKDEVRNQAQAKKSPSPGGQENGSPTSRKRKISSPVLRSLSDAQEHEHLIPVLVDKLYARYREHVLQEIAKEEESYHATEQEIAKTSQETAKERVNGEDTTKHKRTPSISSLLRDDEPKPGQSSPSVSRPATGTTPTDGRSMAAAQQQRPLVGPLANAATPTQGTPGPDPYKKPEHAASASRPASSGTGQQQFSPRDAYSRPPSSSSRPDSRPLPPLSSQHAPVPGQGHAARAPAPISIPSTATSRQQNQSPSMHMDRSSQSPIVLPPPPGMSRGFGSPNVPMHSPQHHPGQPLPNPVQIQQQQPYQQYPHAAPRPAQYQQPGYTYQNQGIEQPPYPHHPPQPRSYQGTPQQVSQYGAYPAYPHSAQPGPVAAQNVPYQQQYGSVPGQRAYPGTPQHPLPLQARHPQVTPASSAARRLPLRVDTSTPNTKWKSTGPRRDKSPVAPPLSPMDMGSPEYRLSPEPEDTIKVASRKSRKPSNARGTPNEADDTPSRPAGRGRSGRGGRGGRRGTTATSTRTRSHSVASQTDDPREATATKNKANNRKVKPEPGTPMDENSSVAESNAGTPLPSGIARRRGNTLRSIETPPMLPRPGQKRKRANTLEVGSPSSPAPATPSFPALPTRPGYILGVRNMPRIAATILNDVTTHKLASMFQKPISEREAPGYRDLVYQPQDLKTIRSQLQAGQRAIIAADAAAMIAGGDVGTPNATAGVTKATSTIWLERSAEVMPPKAIVNSSQLETELCRIFANAVMFNPDSDRGIGPAFRTRAKRAEARRQGKKEDTEVEESDDEGDDFNGGVVKDAREMFQDVERQLAGWRAAERTSIGDGAMGLDGANDEDHPMEDAAGDDKDEVEAEDSRSTRRRKA